MSTVNSRSRTTLLGPSDIRLRYNLSSWVIRHARINGYIGAVRAPRFTKRGQRFYTTEYEMDLYSEREKEFKRLFLDIPRMTEFIGSSYGGMPYQSNRDARFISKQLPYLGVTPPYAYQFVHSNNRLFWHIEDLQLFRRFIALSLNGVSGKDNPCWDDEEMIWRPNYLSPPDFKERYESATAKRVLEQ